MGSVDRLILRGVSVSPYEPEWFRFRLSLAPSQSVQASVQHQVQVLANVFGEEPQDEVAVLLQELPTAVEPTTGETHLRHHISPSGYYRGKKVIQAKD